MKYIWQLAVILTVSFTGELLNNIISLPVPASVWGLAIMLMLLVSGRVKLAQVKEVADFLLNIMTLMFVPAAVGLMTSWERVKAMLLPLTVIIITVTILVMVVSGKVTDFMLRDRKRDE